VLVQVLRYRLAATAVIAGAVACVPLFGPWRLALGATVALVGLATNLWAERWVNRHGTLPAVMALGDVVAALIVMVVVPESYAVAVTVLVAAGGLVAIWFGRQVVAWVLPVTGLGLLAVGLAFRPTLWVASFIAWAVCSVCSVLIFSRLADGFTASRNRYDALVNGIDAAVWEASGPAGPPDYLSAGVSRLLGYSEEELRDLEFLESRIHPNDLAEVLESQRRVAEGEDVERHFCILDSAGEWRRVQDRVRVTRAPDGRVVRRRGILVDETARWEAERSARRYHDLIDSIPIALVIVRQEDPADPRSLCVQAANPAAGDLVGLGVEENLGRPLTDIVPIGDEFLTRLVDVIRTGVALERPAIQLPGVDEVLALKVVRLPDRSLGISLEDVTNRTRMAESLRHRALHDPLTGLPNRALMHERLTRALIQGDRTGEGVGLLLVDLNQFKEVNDALGHAYGDGLLRELARRLQTSLRDCDTVARLGGDEFAVLLTTGATEEGARDVARRLCELCEQPIEVGDYRLQISASVGIALAPEHANDAETLLRRADGAMYVAKGRGGGVAVYSPRHELRAVRRLELLADLREAITGDDFVVHYQPRVDLATLRPTGVEALVRWNHPRHGLLLPEEFIELAEVSGAIRLLTQTVTEQATRAVRGLTDGPELNVSVNLSTRNLYDPTLVEWVTEMVGRLDAPAGSLCFELTESQLMDDPSQSEEVLERLHDVGVRFSVDDFGTGPSSLAVLRALPLDEVKIDRSFVADLERGDDRVVRSVIDLGHHLGLRVVAEGVEGPETLDLLRRLGCDLAQGYHLAMPMALTELQEYLDTPGLSSGPRLGSR
jgi:diguanylate cyclase (GGDEF)-like protein/PAS domain S-box-containing protein